MISKSRIGGDHDVSWTRAVSPCPAEKRTTNANPNHINQSSSSSCPAQSCTIC